MKRESLAAGYSLLANPNLSSRAKRELRVRNERESRDKAFAFAVRLSARS